MATSTSPATITGSLRFIQAFSLSHNVANWAVDATAISRWIWPARPRTRPAPGPRHGRRHRYRQPGRVTGTGSPSHTASPASTKERWMTRMSRLSRAGVQPLDQAVQALLGPHRHPHRAAARRLALLWSRGRRRPHRLGADPEIEDVDRLAGGAALGQHRHAVAGDDDGVGHRQHAVERVLGRVLAPAEEVERNRQVGTERVDGGGRRPRTGRDQHRAAAAGTGQL